MVQAMLRDETWPNSVKVAPEKPLLGRPYRDTGETPRTHGERTRGLFWRFLATPELMTSDTIDDGKYAT